MFFINKRLNFEIELMPSYKGFLRLDTCTLELCDKHLATSLNETSPVFEVFGSTGFEWLGKAVFLTIEAKNYNFDLWHPAEVKVTEQFYYFLSLGGGASEWFSSLADSECFTVKGENASGSRMILIQEAGRCFNLLQHVILKVLSCLSGSL